MIREPEIEDPTHLEVVLNWFSELERIAPGN